MGEVANPVVGFDEQNGLPWPRGFGLQNDVRALILGGRKGKIHSEFGADADFSFEFDPAGKLTDGAKNAGQAEARTFAGGEERFEESIAYFRCHATTGVADG